MSRIRCLDVSTRIRLSNQKRHFSESQSKKVAVFRLSEALCQLVLLCLRRTVSSIT